MNDNRGVALAAAMLVAASATSALAQDAALVPPEPLDLPVPDVSDSEGWVKVRFSVTPEGTTANVRAVDAMPQRRHESVAVRAVEQWTFSPATYDGTPMEWHNNAAVIVLDSEGVPAQPGATFMRMHTEATDQIQQRAYEQAKRTNVRLQRSEMSRLREMGLANLQLAVIEMNLGDTHAAYQAITRATEPSVDQLGEEELKFALQYRFGVELALGRAADALDTYERRVALERLADDDPMEQQARALREALSGPNVLAIQARVADDGWVHEPSRRTFAVGDVEGRVDEIEIECDRRIATLPFEQDVEWSVPESWGECTLTFAGRADTTFTLYELE